MVGVRGAPQYSAVTIKFLSVAAPRSALLERPTRHPSGSGR